MRCGRGGRSGDPVRGDRGLGLSAITAARLRRRGVNGVGGANEGPTLARLLRVLQARRRGEGTADGFASAGCAWGKDDEDERGAVKDAGGTAWWIATRVE